MALGKEPSVRKPVLEKSVLSPPELFWRYITDLAFTVIALSVLFAASRWLSHCGIALRFVALAVASFGAFLCILFFLNCSGSFVKDSRVSLKNHIESQELHDGP